MEDDREDDGKQRMEEGEQAAEVGGSLLVGSAPMEGVIPAAVLPVGILFCERESLCGFFYERPGAFRHRILSAVVRSKVRASADACAKNDRRPSVFMFAVRGSGATRIIVVRGTQRARTLHLHLSTTEPQVKAPGPFRWFRAGNHSSPFSGWDCFGLSKRLSVLYSPRSALAYALARCGPAGESAVRRVRE